MKYYYLALIILISACGEKNKNSNGERVSNDTIPAVRATVSKKPVASYWVVMDKVLDRKFGVDVYETANTFTYSLSMQYDGMVQKDSMEIPNFGIWPRVNVVPGENKFACIIGFLDAKNKFREYKLLQAKNNNLTLSTLKYYSVGR